MVDLRNAYEILVAKYKGKRPCGHTQGGNMKISLKEIACEYTELPC